ncbi:MAG: protease pro-enzyme activation domain-containing protein [Aliidongia sp.]
MGVALPALAVAAELIDASAQPAGREQVGSMTAPQDLGRVVYDQAQAITVHLKLHDQAGFDQAVSALYDPASPTFHHWFTDADFAKYAPTATELQTVRAELERQGLKTVSVDPLNFFDPRAWQHHRNRVGVSHGTAHPQLWQVGGPNPNERAETGWIAGDLVAATVGVERHQVQPQYTTMKNPQTGKPLDIQVALSSSESLPDAMNKFAVQTVPHRTPDY